VKPQRSPVIMVEETIRAYRIPFYSGLADALACDGRRLIVAYSPEASRAVLRGDAVLAEMPWSQPTPFRQLARVGGREITYQSVGEILRRSEDPLVIVNQAVSKAENYSLAYQHRRRRIGFATWGHGRTYSVATSGAVEHVKRMLTGRSDWFFAYTPEGARHVAQSSFPASRITVVRNTIDTDELRRELASITDADLTAFRQQHGLIAGCTGLYLGGVDERKGIDFLLEAVQAIQRQAPGFVLLVGGTGALLPEVQRAQEGGLHVRVLGRVDGRSKALALRASDVMLVPEWIGLVAVDSLVAARPIVTTYHPSHSCELEYLTPDVTCVVTEHEAVAYGDAVVDLLGSEGRRVVMAENCQRESESFSLDGMVGAFREGINSWDEVRACGLTGRAKSPHGSGPWLTAGLSVQPVMPTGEVHIIALMTCHNRVERTLACLRSLMAQASPTTRIDVVLVDDGCTDGTAERIAAEFPDVVVIHGHGDLYWAGGMAVAERVAVREPFDFLLWLNDDVCLEEDAVSMLLDCAQREPNCVVIGSLVDPESSQPSYGGLRRAGRRPMRFALVPAGSTGALDTFNGNVVLIPRRARELIGPIDGAFAHAYADLDYGLRAGRAGVPLTQSELLVGTCTRNHGPSMPGRMIDRWKLSQQPTYQPWRSQVRYLQRYGGTLWPGYLAAGYIRILAGLRK
jgi:glycosyltransferase involved in cell wall biosynthesis